jgi:hypothetical protein
VSEDPIAQRELAALTRRSEEQFAEIQDTLRLHSLAIAGLDRKIDGVSKKLDDVLALLRDKGTR